MVNIKAAFRNLKRNRLFTVLNLISLIIGICSFLTVLLWVNFELSYDKYHSNFKNIYRLYSVWPDSEIDLCCPGAAAKSLKDDLPEVIKSSKYAMLDECKIKYNDAFFCEGSYVDSDFFEIFDFKVIEGSLLNFSKNPNSIVLTKTLASKLFGEKSPLGKIVVVNDGEYKLEVIAVIDDIPENSHLSFDMLIPTDIGPKGLNVWNNNWPNIYVLLADNADLNLINKKLKNYIQNYDPEAKNELSLEPLRRIHLFSADGKNVGKYIMTFLLVSFAILLMSCMNYIILSTSLYLRRFKNIGIRKVLGASKIKIILLLITETIILTIIAAFIALILIEIIRPGLVNLLGKEIIINYNIKLLLLIISILLFTNLLAGLYPAVYTSRLNPVLIIRNKGNIRAKSNRKSGSVRSLSSILLVIQFSSSIFLISTVLGINKQMNYLSNKDIGYSKENVITIPFYMQFDDEAELIKQELLKNPKIEKVTLSCPHPVIQDGYTAAVTWENKKDDQNVITKFKFIDEDFISTFKIQFEEGRFFNKEIKTDYLDPDNNSDESPCSYVINKTLAKKTGFENPLGKKIALVLSGKEYYGNIIGIVNDFNDESLREKVKPVTLVFYKAFDHLNIKFASKINSTKINEVETVIKKYFPDYVSNYNVLGQQINKLYDNERKSKIIFRLAAILAILIAVLGLIGSSSFSIELKQKEIAVRKVNGAYFKDIILLIFNKYFLILLLAIVISIPISYYFLLNWLKNFAYKIELTIWSFLLTSIISVILVFITITLVTFKIARKNPVESLRYE